MLTVTFERREASAPTSGGGLVVGPRTAPGVALRVQRMDWRALGGPWSARILAAAGDGSAERLWGLTDLLRCGITIFDALGPAWWGYVSAVEIHSGARGVRVSLDTLANSIAVRYRAFTPEASGGAWAMTGFVRDERSAQVYGEKERIFSAGQAAEGEAEGGPYSEATAYARSLLALHGSPRMERAEPASPDCLCAVLEARGWWETLDWKIAAEPRGRIANPWTGTALIFGDPAQPAAAQRFTMEADAWPVAEAWLRLRRVGAPADSASLSVRADAGGVPGAVIASAALDAALLSEDWRWARFAFAAPLALAAGNYWLVLSRSGSPSASQYYLASADTGCRFAGGQARVSDGANWSAPAPPADLSLYINGVEETTEQVRRLLLPERCGQFIRGSRIEAASGVLARLYRESADDALRGRAVIETLLARGTSTAQRLLARVEPDRTARVYLQPADGPSDPVLGADGVLRDRGRPLAPSQQPAGQWARIPDFAPAGSAEKAVFVERCVWEEGGLREG